jgi:hypothetical protein
MIKMKALKLGIKVRMMVRWNKYEKIKSITIILGCDNLKWRCLQKGFVGLYNSIMHTQEWLDSQR